eukprot:7379971-Prymnesium_polylepis.2
MRACRAARRARTDFRLVAVPWISRLLREGRRRGIGIRAGPVGGASSMAIRLASASAEVVCAPRGATASKLAARKLMGSETPSTETG